MDLEKFAVLEACIDQLLESFTRLKEENVRLHQRLMQPGQGADQPLLHGADAITTRNEVMHLQTTLQDLQRERQEIRRRLESMLGTIEQLEQFS